MAFATNLFKQTLNIRMCQKDMFHQTVENFNSFKYNCNFALQRYLLFLLPISITPIRGFFPLEATYDN